MAGVSVPRAFRSLRRAGLLLALGLVAGRAFADGLVVHEFIAADPADDLALRATTSDGRLPAAVDTPSGVVPAPADRRQPGERAYGGNSTPDSIDASYRIDRDTTRPDVASYDDPFIPAITPFKRLFAFDAADESTELVVSDRRLRRVEVGGGALPGEDQFFGDLFVDATPGVPVRIPTVGPGARILAQRVEPPLPVEILKDGADNWFLMASERKRLRLVVQLAVPRAVFGAPYPEVSWATLVPHTPLLPKALGDVARDVLSSLGLSQRVAPRDAVATLVAHFRAFAPSDDLPVARQPVELYRELSLSKKGVCRHRAFAFVITSLALGLPARFVRNEAHAWVEVFDGAIWHRIDLGGAAGRFELDSATRAQPHVPPEDPFVWPPGTESTQSAVASAAAAPGSGSGAPATASSAGNPAPLSSPSGEPFATAADGGVATAEERPTSVVDLLVDARDTRRGARLHVRGSVTAEGDACPFSRVDLTLRARDGRAFALGSVPTDEGGRFAADLTVPLQVDVGDYTLSGRTPGAGDCGASP
jgi:transglutaminase-like putative cysteine protease